MMLDALADGGVYAGIPKEIGLRLIAHTMIVSAANNVVKRNKPTYTIVRVQTARYFCLYTALSTP